MKLVQLLHLYSKIGEGINIILISPTPNPEFFWTKFVNSDFAEETRNYHLTRNIKLLQNFAFTNCQQMSPQAKVWKMGSFRTISLLPSVIWYLFFGGGLDVVSRGPSSSSTSYLRDQLTFYFPLIALADTMTIRYVYLNNFFFLI